MKRRITALFLTFCMFGVCGCQQTPQKSVASDMENARVATADEAATVDETRSVITKIKQLSLESILAKPLQHQKARLDVDELLQNPELPTGCESVALTIALRYCGFSLDKTEFADHYLSYGSNIMDDYVGDPYTYYGAGIYPPGLTENANAFLVLRHSGHRAFNTMGTELKDLYKLIDAGFPVVVWTTLYGDSPTMTDYSYTYDGEEYYWFDNEHCVVLCGYDCGEKTVTISDPLNGIVTRDEDVFQEIYDETGRLSMTIIK